LRNYKTKSLQDDNVYNYVHGKLETLGKKNQSFHKAWTTPI